MPVSSKTDTQARNEQVLAQEIQAGKQAARTQFWTSSHDARLAAKAPALPSSLGSGYQKAFKDVWKEQQGEYARLLRQPRADKQSTSMVLADNQLAQAEAGAHLRKSQENLKAWRQAHPASGSSSGEKMFRPAVTSARPPMQRGVSPATRARATTVALQTENTAAAKQYAAILEAQRRG